MKRHAGIGLAVVAALSGSLLIGCSSDDATTATSSTPPANPLVGTWVAAFRDSNVGVLEIRADGTVTYSFGPTRDAVDVVDDGTYQADSDTLTYLTSTYCDDPTDKATYTYTLASDQVTFTNTSGDDKCADRKRTMEPVPWAAETTPPSPSAS